MRVLAPLNRAEYITNYDCDQVSGNQQGEQGLQADGGGPSQDDRVPEVRHEQSSQRHRLPEDLLQRWEFSQFMIFLHKDIYFIKMYIHISL